MEGEEGKEEKGEGKRVGKNIPAFSHFQPCFYHW